MKIFLDDQRKAPEFYTIAIDFYSFKRLINSFKNQITHISLDHYLDSNFHTGLTALQYIIAEFEEGNLPNLVSVVSHSSDEEMAVIYQQFLDDVCPEFPFKGHQNLTQGI